MSQRAMAGKASHQTNVSYDMRTVEARKRKREGGRYTLMKFLIMTALIAATVSPALAGGYPDPDPDASAHAHARARASAAARASSSSTSQVGATSATGGSAQVSVLGGGGNGGGGRAPDIAPPSPAAGSGGLFSCQVVGVGVGGSGMQGGGLLTIATTSHDCTDLNLAWLLSQPLSPQAVMLLRHEFKQVDQAYAAVPASVAQAASQPIQAAQTEPVGRDDWCQTASPAERREYARRCR